MKKMKYHEAKSLYYERDNKEKVFTKIEILKFMFHFLFRLKKIKKIKILEDKLKLYEKGNMIIENDN